MNQPILHEYSGPHRICSLAADALALENLELRDRVQDLERERDSYRELAQMAIHALRKVTIQRDSARQSLRRLQDATKTTGGFRRHQPNGNGSSSTLHLPAEGAWLQ